MEKAMNNKSTIGARLKEISIRPDTTMPEKSTHQNNTGITLIALVITLIVLLILAGITINLSVGQEGIIKRAEEAGKNYTNVADYERNELAQLANTTDNIIANIIGGDNVTDIPTVKIEDTHTITTLTYSWEELEEIANVISDNDDKITRDTLEAKVTIGGKVYTVGVGDLATVTYNGTDKTVRIMGFNHDTLSDTAAYGEGKTNTYAGISFEFVDSIMTSKFNYTDYNTTGWGGSYLRTILNFETELNKLGNGSKIKQVNKVYLLGNKSTTTNICQDKIWLLSCSEIWNNGYDGSGMYGLAAGKEGEQYKYYKDINATWNIENMSISKGSACIWWLRSPNFGNTKAYVCVGSRGRYNSSLASSDSNKVCPGFAI